MTHAISSDLKYALDKYQDVSKHLIRKLKNGDTRFFLLQTNYPKYILTQKELFIFDSDAEAEMVDFEHKYKRPYNKVIRIDEDCFINFNIDDMFNLLDIIDNNEGEELKNALKNH